VIRVFIVAASPLARAGLQELLAARGVEVTGTGLTVEEVGGQLSHTAPHVLLIDASGEPLQPVVDAVLASALASDVSVAILTDSTAAGSSAEALRSGVSAVLPGEISPDQLVAALQAAATGLIVLHPTHRSEGVPIASAAARALDETVESLTRREREVLQMVAGGLGNKEIAARLEITEHTVKFHVASFLGKLGAGSRTEAVSLGIRRGLVLL
jgi:DNA-binding NarL/FixJ family response regulator